MPLNKYWAGGIEMQLTYYIFNINIMVFGNYYINENKQIFIDNSFHTVTEYINENSSNSDTPLMIILHVNDNHYQLLYYNTTNAEDLNIIKEIEDSKNIKSKNLNNKEDKSNIEIDNKHIDNNKVKDTISKVKESLDQNKNNNISNRDKLNMFLEYTMGEDKNFYYNVYIFLKNCIIKNKRTWPEYIENIKDKNEQSIKEIEFYKKIGKIGEGSGKNKIKNIEFIN